MSYRITSALKWYGYIFIAFNFFLLVYAALTVGFVE
jgi:hypothetical protein